MKQAEQERLNKRLAEIDYLRAVARERDAAPHGGKRAIALRAAEHLQVSLAELHRRLAELGLNTPRKTRADAGSTKLTDAEARILCGVLKQSTRANGKRLLTMQDGVEMLRANGKLSCDLTPAQIGRVLRAKQWHPDEITKPSPHTQLASLHPNHVWQIDASLCVLYYLKPGAGGLAVMEATEFEKNKPANYARIANQRVIRYVVTDHFSGAFWVGYFAGAEDSTNLTEAFLSAIVRKDSKEPFCGVPQILMADAASANKGQLFQNLLANLGVKFISHLPGNARATGQVESTQNLVERHFEARLAFTPLDGGEATLQQLNELVRGWRISYNSLRAHRRHGEPRYGCWSRISSEQLRIPPSLELCRDLVSTHPVPATVRGDLTISHSVKGFGSQTYSLRHCGVEPREKVLVLVNPYRAPAIDVQVRNLEGGSTTYTVQPIEKRDGGFAIDAPVIGEAFAAQRQTLSTQRTQQLLQDAYGVQTQLEAQAQRKKGAVAYGGQVNAFADVEQTMTPDWMSKRGVALQSAQREVAFAPLSVTQAAIQLRTRLGRVLTPDEFARLERDHAKGVPPDALDDLVRAFEEPALADQAVNEEPATGTYGRLRRVV